MLRAENVIRIGLPTLPSRPQGAARRAPLAATKYRVTWWRSGARRGAPVVERIGNPANRPLAGGVHASPFRLLPNSQRQHTSHSRPETAGGSQKSGHVSTSRLQTLEVETWPESRPPTPASGPLCVKHLQSSPHFQVWLGVRRRLMTSSSCAGHSLTNTVS